MLSDSVGAAGQTRPGRVTSSGPGPAVQQGPQQGEPRAAVTTAGLDHTGKPHLPEPSPWAAGLRVGESIPSGAPPAVGSFLEKRGCWGLCWRTRLTKKKEGEIGEKETQSRLKCMKCCQPQGKHWNKQSTLFTCSLSFLLFFVFSFFSFFKFLFHVRIRDPATGHHAASGRTQGGRLSRTFLAEV